MTPHFFVALGCCALFGLAGCLNDNKAQNNSSQADMSKDVSEDGGEDSLNDQPPLDCSGSRELCHYPVNAYNVDVVKGGSVTSEDTNRVLPITIRYPTDAPGPRPVVIWSHGGGYNETGHTINEEWGTALSTHGFVVIHIAHVSPSDSGLRTLCMLGGVLQSECVAGNEETGDRPFLDAAVARPYDVKAVLDDLPRIAQRLETEGVQVDTTRVAAAGWSAGSQAPLVLIGASRDLSASVRGYTLVDDRIKAIIALSPQGPGFSGYTEMSYAGITRPALVMTGTNDNKEGNADLTGVIRRQAYSLIKEGTNNHYLLYSQLPVGTGSHGSFNLKDAASSTPNLAHLSEALRMTALAYLDAYLLQDAAAKTWLSTDAPRQLADNKANWLQK